MGVRIARCLNEFIKTFLLGSVTLDSVDKVDNPRWIVVEGFQGQEVGKQRSNGRKRRGRCFVPYVKELPFVRYFAVLSGIYEIAAAFPLPTTVDTRVRKGRYIRRWIS